MSLRPNSLVQDLPAQVYLDLERKLNDGHWQKMAAFCRNGLGKSIFSGAQLMEMEKSNVPGRKLLDYLRVYNFEVQVLQQFLREMQLYDILNQIVTNVPVRVLKPSEDIRDNVEIGETIHLSIAAEGSPEPAFEWKHNSQTCPGKVTNILEINNFSLKDQGEYVCHLTQELGEEVREVTSPKFTLAMKPSAPRIETDLENVSLEIGQELLLSCKALAWPEPSFKWYKDSHLLKGFTGPVLKIKKVDLLVSGSYYCEVSNEVGHTFSRVVSVKVAAPCFAPEVPKVITQPRKTKTSYGLDDRVDMSFEVACRYRVDFECFVNQNPVTDECLRISQKGDYYMCSLHYVLEREEWYRQNRQPFQFYFVAKSLGGTVISNVVVIQVEINFDPKVFTARNKFALLICNSDYPEKQLITPQSDAEMLARELSKLDFRCMIYSNVTRSEFRSAVRLFSEFIQEGDYVVFYFAGHGFHHKGMDFLMPLDYSSKFVPRNDNLRLPPEQIPNMEDCVTNTWISNVIQECRPALLFFIYDACRSLLSQKHNVPEMKDTFRVAEGNSYTLYATSENYGTNEDGKSSLLMGQFIKLVGNKVPVPELAHQFKEAYSLTRVRDQIPKSEGDLNQRRSLTDASKPLEMDKEEVLAEWEHLASVGGVQQKEMILGKTKIDVSISCRHSDVAKDANQKSSGTTMIITNYMEVCVLFTQDGKSLDLQSIWKKGLTIDFDFNYGFKDTKILKGSSILFHITDLQKFKEPLKLVLVLRYPPKSLTTGAQEFYLDWPSVSKHNEHLNYLD